ncbi:uncharacterized protein LOC134301334, partial [Trichomycterus rosablanca]|uniref:uncharacterized protein LOC134301334 n=1 Tax=Trichomycterus rosablanca TaxID=2290929 RepID=UPI002F351837
MQSDEHFEVFTSVFSPQVNRGRHPHRNKEPEKVVVTHSYVPRRPDEVNLTKEDVIQIHFKEGDSRWFGQLQNGQQGYFPASYVIELSQNTHHSDRSAKNSQGLRRHSSVHVGSVVILRDHAGGGKQQAPRGKEEEEGAFLTLKQDTQVPFMAHSSPSLLYRILSKHRKRSQSQGAINGAFKPE